ncbi:hypothetical protein H072_10163 [Dactylellina haptotyla CBS 200.50]|uniref:Zn(2)-C6 fungal-type domain-containing protein n=1 Tax=Dactylellina haptotyla (strain CBS 200.50) TaxID=1284197 RepID=S8A0X7_DACHA|nr:hypothetical protein H072_10163 [Dactylellina haptotyla CBS 200.50]
MSASEQQATKPQRVLACVLCQQRKVKCDRKFPCANCKRARVQCVPATLTPRQRRRRFPEKELIERLQHYENLLRRNDIKFEPLRPSAQDRSSPSEEADEVLVENAVDASSPSTSSEQARKPSKKPL